MFAVDGFALKEACLSTNAHELTENTQLYLLPPLECHVIDYGSEEEGCVCVCVCMYVIDYGSEEEGYVCVCVCVCMYVCVCHCVCHYVYVIFMKEHTHITFNTLPLVVPFV